MHNTEETFQYIPGPQHDPELRRLLEQRIPDERESYLETNEISTRPEDLLYRFYGVSADGKRQKGLFHMPAEWVFGSEKSQEESRAFFDDNFVDLPIPDWTEWEHPDRQMYSFFTFEGMRKFRPLIDDVKRRMEAIGLAELKMGRSIRMDRIQPIHEDNYQVIYYYDEWVEQARHIMVEGMKTGA